MHSNTTAFFGSGSGSLPAKGKNHSAPMSYPLLMLDTNESVSSLLNSSEAVCRASHWRPWEEKMDKADVDPFQGRQLHVSGNREFFSLPTNFSVPSSATRMVVEPPARPESSASSGDVALLDLL